ncbi:hypothetical protein PV325_001906 [Microctonus aethiopoides]|nr:hypothetical protein PV325_001906 [Microctonus aethiopoides]
MQQKRLDHVQPIFYHGENSFAAITYFPHTNTLHGVIDNSYYIENLPLNAVDKPEIVDAFIHEVSERTQRQNRRAKRMNDKRKFDDQAEPSSSKRFKENEDKNKPKKILYPEILLTVDVSSRINQRLEYPYEEAIMYVISYWNAVDMLFRNLKRVDIRINIARIFIGVTDEVVMNMLDDSDYREDENSPGFIQDEAALDSLGRYFYEYKELRRDSFDFLIWMTRASLYEDDEAQGRNNIFGIAAPPEKCGGLHRNERDITNKITNRAIVTHNDKYADFQRAARELAHLMFVYDDDVEVTHGCHNSNCLSSNPMKSSGIMDPSNQQLDDCLMWSYCSEIHFEKYANSKASCCLLNFPYHSLGYRNVMEPLTVKRQCECYELYEFNPKYYQKNICQEQLKCQNENGHIVAISLPLDTTPCVKINNVRHKRDDSPEILHIKYHNDGKVELVTLKKVKDSTLVNSKVPIWNFNHDVGESYVYRLSQLQPIFYHGVNSFAAITYFPHTNTLHGVIDNNYYVENLPLNDAGNPTNADTFIHKTAKRNQRPNHRAKRSDNKRKYFDEAGSAGSSSKKFRGNDYKNKPKETLYPEILLAVDVSSDINLMVQYPYEKSIMYVMSYWNAVDMLFRNVKYVNIRINIAGIFIGKTADVMANIAEHADYRTDSNSRVFISNKNALDSLGIYFHNHEEMLRDSFDFLIWMTRASLIDEDEPQGRQTVSGIATPPENCGGLHRNEIFITGKVTNRAVIMHNNKYANYQAAARELAHLMFVYDDDVEVTHGCRNSNCLSSNPMKSSGIMDPSNQQLDNCLMWSYCSEIHFEKYANSKASCCLLNFPYRSLGLSNVLETLTVEKQCECYALNKANSIHYEGNICDAPLKCSNQHGHIEQVALPLDGTPCVKTNSGFCKGNICVENNRT